ncbi:MAG: outer membrane lipoprotein-sorting protein [Myxococcales bacterium]|nr:outer membrane lipoprotein-sorting protein [Myxococcales bacterium]
MTQAAVERAPVPAQPRVGRHALAACAIALALADASARAAELEPAPEGLSGRAVAERAEDAVRSARTYLRGEMTVVSPRLVSPRVVAFENWDDRPGKRTFIHILSPPKDADTTFLKLHPNLWMYIPRVERTMRIPPSMMLQSWMGSDFTNDDLVRESSQLDDYDHTLLGIDPAPEGHAGLRAYVVDYVPREEAAIVWGKIVMWIEVEHGTPLREEFFDEAGVKLRVMRFGEISQVGGRHYPHLWTMTPLDKPGHETRIRVDAIEFDAEFPAETFTKRNLTRRR